MATTSGGTPYITSTDLVANYPTTSLSLANRADVIASGGPVLVKTSGYTITVADILAGNKFLYNSASGGTFTLPTSSLVDGMVVEVAQIGAGALTVSGGTIVGTAVTSSQYQALRFVYVASGTTWYAVAESSPAGLSIVAPTSIANSGGSASASGGAVTFTGVSSISLNGVFTSTFDNYRVVMDFVGSTPQDIQLRYRSGGADNTTSNYETAVFRFYATNSASGQFWGTNTFAQISKTDGTARTTSIDMSIFGPNKSQFTRNCLLGMNPISGTTGTSAQYGGHGFMASNVFDGLTLYPDTGNITGIVRVYGYKNS